MLEVESGKEAIIPDRLLMEGGSLPQSYIFYDWVFMIVNDMKSGNYKTRIAYMLRSKSQQKLDLSKKYDDFKKKPKGK